MANEYGPLSIIIYATSAVASATSPLRQFIWSAVRLQLFLASTCLSAICALPLLPFRLLSATLRENKVRARGRTGWQRQFGFRAQQNARSKAAELAGSFFRRSAFTSLHLASRFRASPSLSFPSLSACSQPGLPPAAWANRGRHNPFTTSPRLPDLPVSAPSPHPIPSTGTPISLRLFSIRPPRQDASRSASSAPCKRCARGWGRGGGWVSGAGGLGKVVSLGAELRSGAPRRNERMGSGGGEGVGVGWTGGTGGNGREWGKWGEKGGLDTALVLLTASSVVSISSTCLCLFVPLASHYAPLLPAPSSFLFMSHARPNHPHRPIRPIHLIRLAHQLDKEAAARQEAERGLARERRRGARLQAGLHASTSRCSQLQADLAAASLALGRLREELAAATQRLTACQVAAEEAAAMEERRGGASGGEAVWGGGGGDEQDASRGREGRGQRGRRGRGGQVGGTTRVFQGRGEEAWQGEEGEGSEGTTSACTTASSGSHAPTATPPPSHRSSSPALPPSQHPQPHALALAMEPLLWRAALKSTAAALLLATLLALLACMQPHCCPPALLTLLALTALAVLLSALALALAMPARRPPASPALSPASYHARMVAAAAAAAVPLLCACWFTLGLLLHSMPAWPAVSKALYSHAPASLERAVSSFWFFPCSAARL
ncbi:unnamed protein product [Closterium sp. Naga37s-1]|nr:unnamed protein product [Closterium sp. Naga37s-1]